MTRTLPYDVEFGTDGSVAWVVDTGSNDVRPIAVATGTSGHPVTVGAVPDGIGLTGLPSPAATPGP